MTEHFEILLLLARPAAGKSEVIHYLKSLAPAERLNRFHLGNLLELDDFPMLWTWFEEDDLLQRMGHPRLHTDRDGYFIEPYLWNLLIQRIGLDYHKMLRDQPDLHQQNSLLVEFSRGKEHGGYAEAFRHIPADMAARMSILSLQVSWEESLRKNRKRFNPAKPDSILEHGLSDDKMNRLYRENDWEDITSGSPETLMIQGHRVPYVTMPNEDDVTTQGGEVLGKRLEESLDQLWHIACMVTR
jgi:hypothetical protein